MSIFEKGEAYNINNKILSKLDLLEGYPDHYDGKDVEIVINGKIIKAITYFVNQEIDLSKYELLEEFEKDEFYYFLDD